MSMLSAQCDKLRELATRYDELQVGEVKAVTMPSNMGSILREAADTICELQTDNAKLRELLRGWQVYAIDNTFGDIYKSEDVVDSNVVTFCDKHGYRLYTSMEVYGLLHDPNANERILTHDELPETIPCSEVFADIDV